MSRRRERKVQTLDDAFRDAGLGTDRPKPSTAVQDAAALGPMVADEQEIERRETAVKIEKLRDEVDEMTEIITDLRESDEDE